MAGKTFLRRALLAAALALGLVETPRAEMEIWLAHTDRCNACALFDRAAERRGYGETLTYDDRGRVLDIPIRSVAKGTLGADLIAQLSPETTLDANWELNLTVLVVDDGRLLAFGNIAESADNRELRHSDAVMVPPDAPAT